MNPDFKEEAVDDDARLRAFLTEDLGTPSEIDEFLPMIHQLRQWSTPEPTQAITNQLVSKLQGEMSAPQGEQVAFWESYPILLLRSQLRIVKREIWFASLLMTLLGLLVTITIYDPTSQQIAPLTIIAPIVGAIGIGLLYDSDMERILELETATRTSKQVILLARLTLVYGFNLILMFIASIVVVLISAELSFLPLITSWFVPMTFLSALAFFINIFSGDAFLGWATNIGIWSLHVYLSTRNIEAHPTLYALSLPGLATPQLYPLLIVMAVILIAIAIWFVERSERLSGDFS